MVSLVAIWLIFWCFGYLFSWAQGLSTFWLVLILVVAGGAILGFLSSVVSELIHWSSKIIGNSKLSFWSILIMTIVVGGWVLFGAWTQDIDYSGRTLLSVIIYSVLVTSLMGAMVFGAFPKSENIN
jgi:hypothetical protein